MESLLPLLLDDLIAVSDDGDEDAVAGLAAAFDAHPFEEFPGQANVGWFCAVSSKPAR
jgi:hypothetical protein